MTQALPKEPARYFMQEILGPNWDPSNVVGFDPNATSGEAELRIDDSFEKLGDYHPQATVQKTGEESSGGESSYDYITPTGAGQNRVGSLDVQVRVEDTDDDSGYTGDSTTYSAVSAERLSVLIRQEIERVCLENATGADTEFIFVGSNENNVPDDVSNTLPVRRSGAIISYGWLRD